MPYGDVKAKDSIRSYAYLAYRTNVFLRELRRNVQTLFQVYFICLQEEVQQMFNMSKAFFGLPSEKKGSYGFDLVSYIMYAILD